MREWFLTLFKSFLKGFAFCLGILAAGLAAVTVSGNMSEFSSGQTVSATTINENFATLKSAIEGIPDHPTHTVVRVALSGTVTINSGVSTTINFDLEYDPSNLHPTNSSRLNVPSDGVYLIIAELDFDVNAAGNRIIRIVKNAGSVQLHDDDKFATAVPTHMNAAVVRVLSAGEYVEIRAEQYSGGPLDVVAGNMALIKLSN